MAIKLHEIGPRLKLRLVKIEEGVCRGNVVYHAFVKKSKKEIKEQFEDLKKKRELKAERKKKQDENVKRKQAEKEAKESAKKAKYQGREEEDEEGEESEEVFVDKDKQNKKRDKKADSKKKAVAFEEYNDAEVDESKDVRALPKNIKYMKNMPQKSILGKRKK